MSLRTQNFTDSLTIEECYSCHVTFGMTTRMYRERLADKRTFWCPNGHPQCYIGKTEEQKLREELEAEQRRLVRERARADREQADAQHQRRKAAAARGQVTKIKRRVGRGVCPCCNRTFADLQRHMAGQHPGFAETEATS